ncbi:DUF998 domain-containing protein [Leeuwenhoekiella parthenopeia]|uniref:DUF998 domain-containing protein n=1 Tax=Leeuwenhoekiella parthenopeia TaxID=2890320 RepID=A0ABS8GSW3_9FLAO|nr:DUF998 domain-containing protein [Leeuwenhoekiella parthenopeia]MCC4213057.1 DUF998 domain-containing protein [Leeuwenhoekiella parthenopeia]
MTNKSYGIIGIVAPILFCITYIVMSSIRSEYSMLTKAISELGSVDAPNKHIWNFIGYFLTGILIAFYSIGLYKNVTVTKSSQLPLYGILLSGIFMSISGIFAGDFDNPQSTTMVIHTIGSIGSYIFFLIGAFTYPKVMSQTEYWISAKKPTLLFTLLTIVFGTWFIAFPNIPALGQRIVFLFYFLWIFYTGIKLYRQPEKARLIVE